MTKKAKWEIRWMWTGRAFLVLAVLVLMAVIVQGVRLNYQHEKRLAYEANGWIDKWGEPVGDALALAAFNDYAEAEAGRIAKMAGILMGLGGEYQATCEAVYGATTDKVKTEYSITWTRREPEASKVEGEAIVVTPERETITRAWAGSAWGECIAKMMAWKQGGE